jgi:putative transcriptional regulator
MSEPTPSDAHAFALTDSFLIAMPGMLDPHFAGSVVYVCEHNDKGALGLVINRPTDLTLDTLFERIDLKLEIAPLMESPVFFGGPVQTERGFVLHRADGSDYSSSVQVTDGIRLTTSKDVLQAVAGGSGPDKLLVTLGYAGWGGGQLENEIAANGWLTVHTAAPLVERSCTGVSCRSATPPPSSCSGSTRRCCRARPVTREHPPGF